MGKPAAIPTQEVLDFLVKLDKENQPDDSQIKDRASYRLAAAVLAGVDDLSSLNPVGPVSGLASASALLENDMVEVRADRLSGRLTLSADIRRKALSELAERNAIESALAANPKERTGPVQARFESYLLGKAVPAERQTLAELEDSLQALVWLEGVPISHPPLDEVRRRLDYLRLLAPFESLAGDAVFRGRQSELDSLRMYVGILRPQSLLRRIARSTFDWAKPIEQPALSIYGPGGVGKSALVARFMLEHARLSDELRTPFAYLDFERPALDIGRPLTLCVEMIRQLYLQFPIYENFGRLLEFVSRQAEKLAEVDQRIAAQSALADLLGGIERALGPRPYVVTLDTFEEVQYRGEASAYPFWEMLVDLQRQRPFLRVVVSGRAPVMSLRLADKTPNSMEISALDESASIAFLKAQGVTDPDLAARVAGQVGGIPLSLKLAASLIKRDGAGANGVRDLAGRSSFWFSASDEMIQGQLFERILGHIHNPQVERLAHPGLVMRRITPQVILYVLNEPCQLEISTMGEADALFDELRSETALVVVGQDEDEEELLHRPDLRRIMLKLLVQKSPAQVNDIHRRAVKWYSSQHGLRARAEELYHRLQLRETIDKSALDDRSIRFSIQTSISELPLESQLQLAGYGFEVAKQVLERGSAEQQEVGLAARIEQLLPYGGTSVADAAIIANQLVGRATCGGAAYRAAARVAFQEGAVDRGLEMVEQGLMITIPANETRRTLELLREKAWAFRSKPQEAAALVQLKEYARRHQDGSAIIQYLAQSYGATEPNAETSSIDGGKRSALAEIATRLDELSDLQIWELVPALGLVIRDLFFASPDFPVRFSTRLADEGGPFQLATLVDGAADEARRSLVNAAIVQRTSPNNPQTDLAELFLRLCSLWPYRILLVQPPYGSLGSRRLREAV
jgi:hypothetical protein